MRKRIFAAFVCLCMLMALVPSIAYADGTDSVGGLCEHHTEHDSACGYSEGAAEVPCSHEHTEECYTLITNCVHGHTAACYSEENTEPICGHVCSEESGCVTKELNCKHEHDASCGYVPATAGTPCTYDCQICNAPAAEEAKCICETKCTEGEVNADCPVCGENGDISACVGAEKAEEPQCVCDTKCTEEEPNADCPVCGGENGDIFGCVGAAMMLAPIGAGAIEPTKPTKGDGLSENTPYEITNAAELYWFAGLVNGTLTDGTTQNTSAHAKLMSDIVIQTGVLDADDSLNTSGSFTEWTPIGNKNNQYTGTFDGAGYTISGVYVNIDIADSYDGVYAGLFGYVGSSGTIKNVGVKDSYISGSYAGGICGVNYGTIANSYNTGAVSGTDNVGGVCGENSEGIIANSYNTGTVVGIGIGISNDSSAGGVCGRNFSTIENSYNTGMVRGENFTDAGGVCGWNDDSITNSYNTGTVSGETVGGVCGSNYDSIENSYNTGTVTGIGSTSYVGGVCGWNSGSITDCYYLKGTADSSDENVLSEQQFGVESSFDKWDFNSIWQMNRILGRPVLKDNTETFSGTEDAPYLIYNAGQLKDFAKLVNSGQTNICAKLVNDIVINENVLNTDGTLKNEGSSGFEEWTPIGNETNQYIGTFDSDGHTISGLYVNSNADYVGLFGYVGSSGNIKNVGIVDSYISGSNAGGVCGKSSGSITSSYNKGTVSGTDNAGGVCGENTGSITNSYNTGKVGGSHAGGVCGENTGSIVNSYNTGKVSGSNADGVCGKNTGSITNCYYLEGTADSSDGNVLSEQQFGVESSFDGWDFNSVWQMDSIFGRPVLKDNMETFSGTKDDPYLIYNAEQLKDFAKLVNNGKWNIYAKLMNDITINENVLDENGNLIGGSGLEQWTPIGNKNNQYTGTFDGDGYTISGLYVNSNADHVGLFGYVGENGTIKNVGIKDSYISNSNSNVGGVCGYNSGSIENSYNTSTVISNGGSNAGGVCGKNTGSIENSYNTGEVTGEYVVGGVCGSNAHNGSITNSYNTGEVTGGYVGGVCGWNDGSITNCYFLTGTATSGIGTGIGTVTKVEAKDNPAFSSGEVAWLLNDGQNPKPWGQGINDMPVLVNNLPKDVTYKIPVRITIVMPDESTEQYGYTTAGSVLPMSEYPGGYAFYEEQSYQNLINIGKRTYDNDTMIHAKNADETTGITLNKTALSLYINGTDTLTATVIPVTASQVLAWSSSNPSVATVDENGKVTAVAGGTAVITAASIDDSGVQATCTVTVRKKSSGGSVFFWDLKFDTNGGSDIDTVTEWEYSTIYLDDYVPEKEGYKFVGWYADEDLTKEIDEVCLLENITVYAKWEKIEEEVSEETEEVEETEIISFKDVKESDWFYDAVSYAVENGLMSGMSEDIFAPNTPLTREMLAVVLYNAEGQPESTGVNAFTDVKGDMWYTEAILWANENGIVAGYDNGAYGVGDFITREQFATILYRYAQFKGYDTTQGGMAVREFSDYENISDYAKTAMAWAVNAGIMSGNDDNTLNPQGKATRAEAATMLMNFCENVMK